MLYGPPVSMELPSRVAVAGDGMRYVRTQLITFVGAVAALPLRHRKGSSCGVLRLSGRSWAIARRTLRVARRHPTQSSHRDRESSWCRSTRLARLKVAYLPIDLRLDVD